MFQPGQQVRISEALREIHPLTPIAGMVLTVADDSEVRKDWKETISTYPADDVPVLYEGRICYVGAAYVSAAEEA